GFAIRRGASRSESRGKERIFSGADSEYLLRRVPAVYFAIERRGRSVGEVLYFERNNFSRSGAASGRNMWNPWQSSQPSLPRSACCSAVSTPSATTLRARLRASDTLAETMAASLALSQTLRTNDPSTFRVRTGRRLR